MEAKAKLFGHPIHQMLVPIPFGLLAMGALLDIADRFVDITWLTLVSFYDIAIGLIAALVAAVFGAVDWSAIPNGTRAKRVGLLHAIANVSVILLFAFSLFVRADEAGFAVPLAALAAEVTALVVAIVAGWLGGELVDRLGIGVHPDAHPDFRPRRRRPAHAPHPARSAGEGGFGAEKLGGRA